MSSPRSSAALVARLLRESGRTKSAFSAAAGVSRSQLDSYLHGVSQPSWSRLQQLADAAGLRLDVEVRPRPPRVPEQFLAVLEFGDLFPRRPRPPLPARADIWGHP